MSCMLHAGVYIVHTGRYVAYCVRYTLYDESHTLCGINVARSIIYDVPGEMYDLQYKDAMCDASCMPPRLPANMHIITAEGSTPYTI